MSSNPSPIRRIVILSVSRAAVGGVERFSEYLRRAASEAGFEAVIVGREDLRVGKRAVCAAFACVGLGQPALGFALGCLARRRGFDVCVTNGLLGWNLTGRGIVNVQHGTFARAAERIDRGRSPTKFFIKRYLWGAFEGLAARRARICVAVSEETRESVVRYYRRSDVCVVLNAVDTALFAPGSRADARGALGLSPDERIAVFTGRFEFAKGRDILERMQAQGGMRLLVAESHSQERLALLYRAADAFVLPSLHEGCSYALLEAMSSGLPFVAGPVGLVADLVRQGLFPECIVTEHAYEAYKQAFESLCAMDPDGKAKLTAALRSYIVESHGLERFNGRYLEIFAASV